MVQNKDGTITVRINSKLKKDVEEILKSKNLKHSDLIECLYKQIFFTEKIFFIEGVDDMGILNKIYYMKNKKCLKFNDLGNFMKSIKIINNTYNDVIVFDAEEIEHNNKMYHIIAWKAASKVMAMAFCEGIQADGYQYSVDLNTKTSFEKIYGNSISCIDEFFKMIKENIKTDAWKKFCENRMKMINRNNGENL